MKIGELAKISGVRASRIRFYEASGLIQAVARQANGYRDYSPAAVAILDIIASARHAGFSLEEIRHLLPLGAQGRWQPQELLVAIEHKIGEIDAMQQRLSVTRGQLMSALDSIKQHPADLSCVDRAKWLVERLHAAPSGTASAPGRDDHAPRAPAS